jgi:endonuclease G
LNGETLTTGQDVDRKHCEFFEDGSVHQYFRSANDDYKGSGYDRGHLAAAGNHRFSQSAVQQTFTLSNISPQVGKGFNRDAWNNLERYVRYRAKAAMNTWVCTGPLYLPRPEADGKKYVKYQVIGKNHVSVPTHFFKVIVVESKAGDFELESYLMPNQAIDDTVPLQAFQVPPDSIERASGFLLFSEIPRNKFRAINGRNKFLDKFTQSAVKKRGDLSP